MPDELNLDNLFEITTQPLLNYLVALSYVKSKDTSIDSKNKIIFSENTNLNAIYQDLLKSVYDRGWDTEQHPTLKGVTYLEFVRILEEIALTAWHGNGRTTTVQEISDRCASSGLKKLLEKFAKGAESGVTNLLTSFYFRQSGFSNDGDRTTERRRSNSWAFFQLRMFLEYKGLINGVEVIAVSPRYSSQTCHSCLHIGLRSGKSFKCTNSICSWKGDADFNASLNLSAIGGVVSLLRGSDALSCKLNRDDSGLLKHSA